jgi:hypothetical protein
MWPNNCARLHHTLGSLQILTPINCKDCQMLAIRFLEISNWLYPNMITFLWYNEKMDMKAKSLITIQCWVVIDFWPRSIVITGQFVLDLLTTNLIDNCLVLNSQKSNNLPGWPDYHSGRLLISRHSYKKLRRHKKKKKKPSIFKKKPYI